MDFKGLINVTNYFSDNNRCIDFLSELRWGLKPNCIYCRCETIYKLKSIKGYFKCKSCQRSYSVVKGTIFEKSSIPLQKWFLAIYLLSSTKKGISSIQLSRYLDITQKSAWFVLQRIRYSFATKSFNKVLGAIQCDESYIGGKNKNRSLSKKIANSQGRSLKDKTPIFGMLETGGSVYVEVIPDAKGKTVKSIIEKRVEPGSIIISDEWKAYLNMPLKFHHVVLNHSKEEYARGGFHNNSIEGFWSLLKRGIYGIYHQVSPKHLGKYCDEFSYRYNTRRLSDSERFRRSSKALDGRLMYKDLTRKQNSSLK
jgi:transposase-like protein